MWSATFVDVVGWLVIYHVYTAHMTGNTSALGIALADHNWTQALHHAWPILPFVLGLVFGATAWRGECIGILLYRAGDRDFASGLVSLVRARYSTGGQLTAASASAVLSWPMQV